MAIVLFIHPFDKNLVISICVPGTILGTRIYQLKKQSPAEILALIKASYTVNNKYN